MFLREKESHLPSFVSENMAATGLLFVPVDNITEHKTDHSSNQNTRAATFYAYGKRPVNYSIPSLNMRRLTVDKKLGVRGCTRPGRSTWAAGMDLHSVFMYCRTSRH